eukprot:761895-Prymnesium_polylepis.1
MGPGWCCTAAASQVPRTEHTNPARRSERAGDLTPQVLNRLYGAHDCSGQVPANWLRHAITAVGHISLGD